MTALTDQKLHALEQALSFLNMVADNTGKVICERTGNSAGLVRAGLEEAFLVELDKEKK